MLVEAHQKVFLILWPIFDTIGLVLKGFHQIQTKIPIQAGIIWVYCCCPPIVVPPAPLPHQHCCCPTTSSPSSAHGSPRFPALAPASDSGVPFQPRSHSHAGRPVLTWDTIKLKPRRYLLNKTLFGMDFELVWIT